MNNVITIIDVRVLTERDLSLVRTLPLSADVRRPEAHRGLDGSATLLDFLSPDTTRSDLVRPAGRGARK